MKRVSVPWASVSPISLVHSLMVAPFLSPSNIWHIMHTKADKIGITQRVTPFTEWLREATINPQKEIIALTRMELADSIMDQRQWIKP